MKGRRLYVVVMVVVVVTAVAEGVGLSATVDGGVGGTVDEDMMVDKGLHMIVCEV
jgi:hypothetical protein